MVRGFHPLLFVTSSTRNNQILYLFKKSKCINIYYQLCILNANLLTLYDGLITYITRTIRWTNVINCTSNLQLDHGVLWHHDSGFNYASRLLLSCAFVDLFLPCHGNFFKSFVIEARSGRSGTTNVRYISSYF